MNFVFLFSVKRRFKERQMKLNCRRLDQKQYVLIKIKVYDHTTVINCGKIDSYNRTERFLIQRRNRR